MLVDLVDGGVDGAEALVQAALPGQGLNGAAGLPGGDQRFVVLDAEALHQVAVRENKPLHVLPGQPGLALLGGHGEQLAEAVPAEAGQIGGRDAVLKGLAVLPGHGLVLAPKPAVALAVDPPHRHAQVEGLAAVETDRPGLGALHDGQRLSKVQDLLALLRPPEVGELVRSLPFQIPQMAAARLDV